MSPKRPTYYIYIPKGTHDWLGSFQTWNIDILSTCCSYKLARFTPQLQGGFLVNQEAKWMISLRYQKAMFHIVSPILGQTLNSEMFSVVFLLWITANHLWLVVSTPLNNISHLGWFFPIYGKIKYVPKHQPDLVFSQVFVAIISPDLACPFTIYTMRSRSNFRFLKQVRWGQNKTENIPNMNIW